MITKKSKKKRKKPPVITRETMIISCGTGTRLDTAPKRTVRMKRGIACFVGTDLDNKPQVKYPIIRTRPGIGTTCNAGDVRPSGVFNTSTESWVSLSKKRSSK